MFKPSIPVLMYHHVRPGAGMIACTPEHFESQLQWLQDNHYVGISLDEFAQHLAGENIAARYGGAKPVLITFDDGYLKLGYKYLYTTEAFGRNTSSTSALAIHRFAVRNRSGQTLGKRIRASHHPFIAPVFNTFKAWRRRQRQ